MCRQRHAWNASFSPTPGEEERGGQSHGADQPVDQADKLSPAPPGENETPPHRHRPAKAARARLRMVGRLCGPPEGSPPFGPSAG